ncbi:MAG: hypothetical protein ABWZ54_05525 [Luteibacter sp.]
MFVVGFIFIMLPQILTFAALLCSLVFMVMAWRRTRNSGYMLLIVSLVIGQLVFLAARFGFLYPINSGIGLMAFHTWIGALTATLAAIGWWLITKRPAGPVASLPDAERAENRP